MLPDRFAGIACVALAAGIAVAAFGFYVPYQYEPLGPAVFPYLVAAALCIAGERVWSAGCRTMPHWIFDSFMREYVRWPPAGLARRHGDSPSCIGEERKQGGVSA